jgi:hypothetical protein
MSDRAFGSELPIVDELGAALYAAAVKSDRSTPASRSLRALGRWLHRPLVVALVVTAASGTMGGLALAGTFNGTTINPQAWVNGQRVTPEPAATPGQTATLAILQRPRVAEDALPPYYSMVLPNSPTGGGDGVNVALSRRAYGFSDGAAAWVIPGNDGTVCLVAANAQAVEQADETGTPTHISGAEDSVNCETLATVDSGWPLSYGGGPGDTPGVFFTAGIVPNGVAQVTVGTSSGQSVSLPVHDNIWLGDVTGVPETETFNGPNGPVTSGGGTNAAPPTELPAACKRLEDKHRGGVC